MTRGATPLRIFVVENDDDARRVFTMYLARRGHAVESAASIAETVDKLRGQEHDVLIADIGLPDGNGWELLHRLRTNGVPAPPFAIAMTGFSRGDDIERSRTAGYRHHLVKPLDTRRLAAILDEAARAIAPPA